jgi:hypothetical protein
MGLRTDLQQFKVVIDFLMYKTGKNQTNYEKANYAVFDGTGILMLKY